MKENFEAFYNERFSKFGATAEGVGWKNATAQNIRFRQLIRVIANGGNIFSINDLGCGTADLIAYLNNNDFKFNYWGYDVLPEMIRTARLRFDSPSFNFKLIESAREMDVANYTVASGIFNIRFNCDDDTWLKYILETIAIMNEKSTKGFSFNILTKYSDAEHMRRELFYADPCFIFDYCKRNFSKNVALLHDYDQYDFTILVRK